MKRKLQRTFWIALMLFSFQAKAQIFHAPAPERKNPFQVPRYYQSTKWRNNGGEWQGDTVIIKIHHKKIEAMRWGVRGKNIIYYYISFEPYSYEDRTSYYLFYCIKGKTLAHVMLKQFLSKPIIVFSFTEQGQRFNLEFICTPFDPHKKT